MKCGAGLGPWQWASCEGTSVCPPVAISLVGCSRQLLMACRNHDAFELVAQLAGKNRRSLAEKQHWLKIESRVRIVCIKAVLVDANAMFFGGKVTFIVAVMMWF